MHLIPRIQTAYAVMMTKKDHILATLRPGMVHGDCHALTAALEYAGYYQGETLGEYPEWLRPAVMAMQDDAGLIPDGVVGKQTWGALRAGVGQWNSDNQPPVIMRAEIDRLNTLLDPAVWGACGYYSATQPNDAEPPYLIGRANAAQRAVAKAAGKTTTHGMTCGHFGDYFAKLYLGIHDPRIRHTGMNLGEFWKQRDNTEVQRSSTCGAGLLSGKKVIDAGDWKPRVHGCYPAIRTGHPEDVSELSIIEYGSHIICRLTVTPDSGIIDPRTGLRARPGVYRIGADGTKANPGRPWTFRRWRESDNAGIRNNWSVRRTHASAALFRAVLEGWQ